MDKDVMPYSSAACLMSEKLFRSFLRQDLGLKDWLQAADENCVRMARHSLQRQNQKQKIILNESRFG